MNILYERDTGKIMNEYSFGSFHVVNTLGPGRMN